MATAMKDMWVANLVEPRRGDSSSISVIDVFENTEEAAEMGRLSSKGKVRLARLKLRWGGGGGCCTKVLFHATTVEGG
jgi:hypothetical protein